MESKLKKISVYGASGHAKVVIDIIKSDPKQEIGYVFDDNNSLTTLMKHTVYSPIRQLQKLQEFPVLLTIGDNTIRKKIAIQVDCEIAKAIIHQTAVISPSSNLGVGSVVMPGAIINAEAEIGKHVIINTGAVVEHDCTIADFAHISPNAALAGNVSIGEGTHVGIGAQVIQGVKIGKWCTIGAGAVIIEDVPDGVTVVGNPGKVIKFH